ncbi:MAG: redox-sensing transcriptional repressor [Candidatus Cloacimonadota bacterium]|jgi:redox-sensing transcriptional repressor|nr:redox-sensing transcriptional repressor [Candidatus Cloacimonadota bacterium]
MKKPVSDLTLRRFPKYIQFLKTLQKRGEKYTSASEIARRLGVHHTQVRKDLALTGVRGIPKVGHKVDDLIKAITKFIYWDEISYAFLVGAGHLGTAILHYQGFVKAGFQIVAAFDKNPEKIGKNIASVKIYNIDRFSYFAEKMDVRIGIITTTSEVAQKITDLMVKNGIKAIWNFTPIKLSVPADIIVENVDIYPSLAVLLRKLHELEKASRKK